MAFGVDVPDRVAHELEAVVGGAAAAADSAAPPSSVARCVELLEDAFGPVVLSSGLSYVIPPGVRVSSTADVTRSDRADVSLLGARSVERELERRRVADAPRWRAWPVGYGEHRRENRLDLPLRTTRGERRGGGRLDGPGFRGQGHAAAVVAAWASLLAPTGRQLFFSTFRENRSSQRVAARLRLQQIGWIWEISRQPATDRPA